MKKILFLVLIGSLSIFVGCEEGDGDKDLGYQFIYMPQATTSAGLNNHYKVPSGDGKLTYNFTIDKTNNRINVLLGVLLSGTGKSNGFSVEIQALIAQTQSIIDDGAIDNGILLPAVSYILPEKVIVENGSNSAAFALSIDRTTIEEAANAGKILMLEVGIANPSAYEIAAENTTTLVLVEVDALKEILEWL